MIALAEKATDPAAASARPGHGGARSGLGGLSAAAIKRR
jgi:hypothetical protein